MSDWIELKTIDDIPKDYWSLYEWQILVDGEKWVNEPHKIALLIDWPKVVQMCSEVPLRYRKKQLPSDEYIEARIWDISVGDNPIFVTMTAHKADSNGTVYYQSQILPFEGRNVRPLSWFLEAKSVLKTAIKEGYGNE